MVRLGFKALAADVVVLTTLYFVLSDLAWRTHYSGTPHAGVSGYAPSTSYSFLTRFFTMAGNGVNLASPPTLDWVQVLSVVLVVVNGWYLYAVLRSRRGLLDPLQQAERSTSLR